ncbi:25-hydroxycholesterol 7-alpha-hydroxylase [Colletotrichum siamense]|uniref:25-hydroxycholesterol 7-alpha-hydroxylase n=1 Tax=Colletotrichum siamense TaxID=690259 RepID=UPI001872D744|nr:25-hydroxycholesterol 7-alpha-hydroxylase [Colletotrichum siamense]KAF5510978.1 25-hydroxycholesterol 7-alpha-hydroxylase [Colletotrichum siamense]
MASISLAGTFFASHGYDSWLLLILAAILLVGGSQLRGNSQDPREPPALKPKIPVVGHIIGLLGLRQYYYRQLGHENPNLPVFSISMGGSQKMYIIKDPQLSQVAMRNKALSLIPFMAEFAEKMVGFGPNIMNLFHHPPTDGSLPWTDDQHRSYAPLSPGPDLLEMNTYVLKRISQTINSVGPELENKTLYLWLRDAFTKATLGSLFGDKSSLTASPTLIQDLWDYDAGQSQLLMQPFPSITARQAYGGRSRVQQALRKYFLEEFDQISNVSAVVKRRVAVNRKWGLPSDDVADHEFGMLFASVTNAIPTLFWMTCYVFRDPKLVEELRKELLDIAVIQDQNETAADGQNVLQFHWPRKCTFPLAKLSSACPLLLSTYKEVMRLTNRNAGTRRVVEDTVISYTPTTAVGETAATQSYLLKKGANVQVPSIITNFDPATWGPNAHEFDARRFLAVDKERERTQSRAFNPFGSGKHLCPGRFFADAEILGALAALILGFEIETPEGGRVQVPPIKNNLAEAVPKPLQTVQDNMMVRIRRRPGWEDVEWAFVASNGKS